MSKAVVIDNGTGFTKMGYSGNFEPSHIIPTVFADNEKVTKKLGDLDDLDFYIGDEALANYQTYNVSYPIRHGCIDNWDHMEKLWQQCIYKYLRCEPEEHHFLLTEPPLNPPENREYTAEVMFETFGVKGLYIGVQAVLALCASWTKGAQTSLTGCVIDSGDGVTHVTPVADGYVITSGMKSIPLAGRDVTNFVLKFLQEREGNIPREDALQIAQRIKEKYCYICPDVAKEFHRYDQDPMKYITKHFETYSKTKQDYSFDVGPEKFLAPEIFFTPSIFTDQWTTPLAEVVDDAIRLSPIDCRKGLYANIVLSGGSTMFGQFGKRLKRDVKKIVDARSQAAFEVQKDQSRARVDIPVEVVSHPMQRSAVWFGGSMLSSTEHFYKACHTKAEYEEHGPSICRYNQTFGGAL